MFVSVGRLFLIFSADVDFGVKMSVIASVRRCSGFEKVDVGFCSFSVFLIGLFCEVSILSSCVAKITGEFSSLFSVSLPVDVSSVFGLSGLAVSVMFGPVSGRVRWC